MKTLNEPPGTIRDLSFAAASELMKDPEFGPLHQCFAAFEQVVLGIDMQFTTDPCVIEIDVINGELAHRCLWHAPTDKDMRSVSRWYSLERNADASFYEGLSWTIVRSENAPLHFPKEGSLARLRTLSKEYELKLEITSLSAEHADAPTRSWFERAFDRLFRGGNVR